MDNADLSPTKGFGEKITCDVCGSAEAGPLREEFATTIIKDACSDCTSQILNFHKLLLRQIGKYPDRHFLEFLTRVFVRSLAYEKIAGFSC